MEKIEDKLDEKWVEEGKPINLGISPQRVYLVDRPPARSTGHTENEKIHVLVNVLCNFTVQCTR